MPSRKKLIIGNWKMNFNTHDASIYLHRLQEAITERRDVQVIVAPTTLTLQSLSLQVNRRKVKLAAQNFYWRDFGPYTGETSATQLRGIVDYGLVGHSERRYLFHEQEKDIRYKVQAAVRNGFKPILCIGETRAERTNKETHAVLYDQLTASLANITSDEVGNVIIAYEPVWAIGTGDNAKPSDVIKAGSVIRRTLRNLYGDKISKDVQIVYGGSVTSSSATDYLSIPGIDGLLVGGASLRLYEFSEIIKKAHDMQK